MRSVGVTRKRRRLTAAAALALAVAGLAPAGAAAAPTRYSLASGCYALQGPSGQVIAGAERVRMQATTLGSYLLYRPDRTFLAAQDDGSVAPAPEPSPAADWRVREAGDGTFTLSPASAEGRTLTARFVPATGCAVYPEADLNATGTPARNIPFGKGRRPGRGPHALDDVRVPRRQLPLRPPVAPVRHPVRAAGLLVDRGAAGRRGAGPELPQLRQPGGGRTTRAAIRSSPSGASGNLTYEGTYWRWIERAWLGGLRLMVMGVNENRVLCELQANRKTNCDEMDTVRRGFAGHPRAAALRRRAGRRPRQGLLPDRHRPATRRGA